MNLKNKLWNIYNTQQVNPGFLGVFINPFYFARKGLFNAITSLLPKLNGKVLDVGCGNKPYQTYCKNITKYIGLELDTENNRANKKADYYYDGINFPFDDKQFDSVLCNQVLEHVFNPNKFLSEINRILKADGKIVLSVPFVWDEHEQPYDFARYSSFGLKHLFENHGFEIISTQKTCNDIRVIFQLINAYIFKCLQIKSFKIRFIFQTFLTAPVTVLGIVLNTILPKNNDLYLDNVLLIRKVKDE